MSERVPEKEIVEVILQTKKKFPELRVGQIIANAVRYHAKGRYADSFYISDEELLIALKESFENYE